MDLKDVQRSLEEIERDPRAAMSRIPEKRDRNGTIINAPSAFSAEDIRTGAFVTAKDAMRGRFRGISRGVSGAIDELIPGRAAMEEIDRPEDLVDTLRYARPEDIDAAGLSEATLAVPPWSGDYWPTYLGLLGRRYADKKFPASDKWEKNHAYVRSHPAAAILKSDDEDAIDLLSPAEKYDILVGDGAFSLTEAMWKEGKAYFDRDKKVEKWMGICDGWAAAAYMLPRPSHTATVIAANGATQIQFYPSDIKALAALLWAKGRSVMKFIGSRCDQKHPKTDENGRLIDPACFNTNPGTLHVALVNQIGVARRSLIMDTTYDYEVWNQPILGYEYHYFNPQTMQAATNLKAASVPRAQFTKDRFKKYRSDRTTTFVGVHMRVRYIAETWAEQEETDGPENDLQVSVDYTYDLELDEAGKILGGEWYLNTHPDFLWTPAPGVRALSVGDGLTTGQWNPKKALPISWQKAAARTSAHMQPIGKIVERLIALANA